MNRCLLSLIVAAPLCITATMASSQTTRPAVQSPLATSQPGHRNFPSHAQIGVLKIAQIPHAQINDNAIRTAPGFRLFSADNKLIFAHTVLNQDLRVVYLKEASTQWLLTAWILTPQEIAALSTKR